MSRSYQRTISWGKSKAGVTSRKGYREPLRKDNGKPCRKNHYRAFLQTYEDYIEYVRRHFYSDTKWTDMFDRRRWSEYQKWLGDREETEDLIREYANILFKKDRSC